jgi:hypothetical protein
MPKALRYLRIAWSVGCGILCLLLIGLWVRSNGGNGYYCDYQYSGTRHFQSRLIYGSLYLGTEPYVFRSGNLEFGSWQSAPIPNDLAVRYWTVIPLSVPTMLFGLAAATPWLRWRFSLRTLLIAMTLLAVVLGAIVFSMQ